MKKKAGEKLVFERGVEWLHKKKKNNEKKQQTSPQLRVGKANRIDHEPAAQKMSRGWFQVAQQKGASAKKKKRQGPGKIGGGNVNTSTISSLGRWPKRE